MTLTPLELAAAFSARSGDEPAGIWSASGRVNLIGEHTDYNDGFVLPFAVNHSTMLAARPRHDRTVRVCSTFSPDDAVTAELDALVPCGVNGWAAYPLGVLWAIERAGYRVPGMDLLIHSSVPVGAGLSSSAALECAVAVAANELSEANLSRTELVAIGQLAENEMVGAPTGIMDQSASLLGEAGHAVFLDCRSRESRLVPLDLAGAGLELLVLDTRVSHSHSTGSYAARRRSCELGAELMGVTARYGISRWATSRKPPAFSMRRRSGGCATSSPRTPGYRTRSTSSPARDRQRLERSSSRVTRPCATTSKFPAPNLTSPSTPRFPRARSGPG